MGRTRGPSEKAITAAVVAHWKAAGRRDTLVAAIPNAGAFGQAGLTKGLADLVVIGPRGVGFIELKTETGKPSAAQDDFAKLCRVRNVAHAFTFGRDQPISVLRKWGVIP